MYRRVRISIIYNLPTTALATGGCLVAGVLGYLLSGISQFDAEGERGKKQ